MTKIMTVFGISVLPAAALCLSVFGTAGGSKAHVLKAKVSPELNCSISVSKGRFGHTYEALVSASRTVNGIYTLSLRKKGGSGHAMIDQSGEFYVGAGHTETLSEATFGGLPPTDVDAKLTVWWDGQMMTCTNQLEI